MKNVRKGLIEWSPHIMWTLSISLGYTLIMNQFTTIDAGIQDEMIMNYFLKGLWLIIPLVLLKYIVTKVKYRWQLFIVSILITGLMLYISGEVLLGVLTAILCMMRLYNCVLEEKSCLEQMELLLLALFPFYFIVSGLGEIPMLQKLSVYSFVLCGGLTFIVSGLLRIEKYIELRKNRANLPQAKLLNGGTKIFVSFTVIIMCVVLFVLHYEYEYVSYSWETSEYEYTEEVVEEEGETEEDINLFELYEVGETNQYLEALFSVLEKIFVFIFYLLMVFALYKAIRSFIIARNVNSGTKIIIEETFTDVEEDVAANVKGFHIREFFDFSPEMKVRRRYKKTLKSYHPKNWQSPSEMEEMAQIEIEELHYEYEAVRYGKGE